MLLIVVRAVFHDSRCQEEPALQAVSKPKDVGTAVCFRSPSIVLGTPITHVFRPVCSKL